VTENTDQGAELLDQAALEKTAEELAATLRPGDTVLFTGELGSGKTTFIRAMLRTKGITGHMPSPSFIVDAVYSAPDGVEIHHVDLYRLEANMEELEEFGISDLLMMASTSPDEPGGRLAFVEWAEKLPPELRPSSPVRVFLEVSGELHRLCRIEDQRVAGD
jgi:tRNA threonylcarbamoyl adenosine modification protein YjeE